MNTTKSPALALEFNAAVAAYDAHGQALGARAYGANDAESERLAAVISDVCKRILSVCLAVGLPPSATELHWAARPVGGYPRVTA
ncbi:MAG: hypothetical protein ACSLEZ_15100 [Thiobacillus sp.]